MTEARIGEAKLAAPRAALGSVARALDLAIVVIGYFGVAAAAQMVAVVNAASTPLWPPSGIALGLILVRGYRVAPAIFAAASAASAVSSGALALAPLLQSLSIAAGTTLAALAGAWLLERWASGTAAFATPLGVGKFVAAAFLPTALISSGTVIAGYLIANGSSFDAFAPSAGAWAAIWTTAWTTLWATWWLADAAGIVLVTPVIVLWAATPLRPFAGKSLMAAAATILLAAAIGILAYGPPAIADLDAVVPDRGLAGVLIMLPLLWACLRGSARDAATAALIFSALAAWGCTSGVGPFAGADSTRALVLLLALSLASAIAPLVLSAAIAGYRDRALHAAATQSQLRVTLEDTQSALKNARRHFQIFIEGVADYAIFLLDTAGRVASWNSSAQHIIGYKADEILGKHFGIFYRPDERRAGEPNRALEHAAQRGKHEVEGWRIRKNGTLLFVTGALTAIRDDDGKLIGFANVIRDATERRDTQEKLVEAREQLAMAQKMEAIGKLTGGIAHDFNNLLMIIGGNAQTFRRLLDPKLPRAIEAIQTAAKRGESLTRQLLTFSRRQHLNPTVVDLNASIRNMRTLIESSLRGNIVYSETLAPELWPVKVDLAELELAIVNIAVNARDAMPNGGTFTLTAANVKATADRGGDGRQHGDGRQRGEQHHGDLVAVAFSDSGLGIPPNLLSKIFDPFFTTKEVGKGTGLGLSQVYGFAHQAGGTVQAESKVGHGTTVTIYLPSFAGAETVAEEVAEPDAARSLRPMVLIVDDSAEVAEVTSSLFEHLGYDTVYRDSAEAALKLLGEGAKIDLVFSDIVMPGTIDGVGLAAEVRARYPRLPVILTTGYSDAAQVVPPDLPILRKPFDTEALRGVIQDYNGRLAS